ncbi:hypothetical protein [Terasakiella pusilla]|uniref:hypothetical protein n=1 Tax=Terasakiella pusilla TaxID=64973 RepID=UPI00048ACD6A|nr:hypothetical protein [Terasakiella pusilla]
MKNSTIPNTLAFWIVASQGALDTFRSIGLTDEANEFENHIEVLTLLWSREHGEEFDDRLEELRVLLENLPVNREVH